MAPHRDSSCEIAAGAVSPNYLLPEARGTGQ